MTHLLVLLPLLAGQTESPPPATTPPPVLRMEGSTTNPPPPPPPSAKTPPAEPAPAAPAAAPAPPAAQVAPAVPAAPADRGAPVFLTINSNRKDLKLLRQDNDEQVCDVPCNRLVPAGAKDLYYLGGKGITSSNDFDLAEGIKAARIDVRAGGKVGKIMGIILTAVGIPMLLSGGLSMASYALQTDPTIQQRIQASGQQQLFNPTVTLVIGLIELIVGAGAATTGLILWPTNTTTMSLIPAEPPGNPAPSPPAEARPAEPPPAPAADPAPAPAN